jgi:hypothetical protein
MVVPILPMVVHDTAEEKAGGAVSLAFLEWEGSGALLQAKMPQNPSLGRFSDNVKVWIGFLNSYSLSWQ